MRVEDDVPMSEALYRKYRPQIFEDVVGQEHIERTIKNAIEQDKVSHAYLFTGPRGTGKTTTARLLAKALLCEHGPTPEPDGTCDDCVMIANGEHPDVYELDAASRTGVENVREEIIGRVQFAPTRGRYKIYIIDEVHMLSTAAFNALLKTLEEPPSHVVFILATTDPQKVPETIHSRCQRFDFRRISQEALVSRLGAVCVSEGVEFEGEALDLIAHRAEGGMRNALTSLEQLIAFGEGRVTLEVAERMLGGVDTNDLAEIVRAIGTRDVAACFRWTAEFVETGADLAQFTRDLAEHARNLYVMALVGTDVPLEVSDAVRRELASELPLFGPDRLARLLGVLGDLSAELKTSTNPRLSFEIALTRMVRPDSDLTLEALAERVEALESGYSAVAHVTSAPVGAWRVLRAAGLRRAARAFRGGRLKAQRRRLLPCRRRRLPSMRRWRGAARAGRPRRRKRSIMREPLSRWPERGDRRLAHADRRWSPKACRRPPWRKGTGAVRLRPRTSNRRRGRRCPILFRATRRTCRRGLRQRRRRRAAFRLPLRHRLQLQLRLQLRLRLWPRLPKGARLRRRLPPASKTPPPSSACGRRRLRRSRRTRPRTACCSSTRRPPTMRARACCASIFPQRTRSRSRRCRSPRCARR